MSTLKWDDKQFKGLVGDKEVQVLACCDEPVKDNETNKCVLFTYPNSDETKIWALRWSLGAVLDLGTTELDLAKGSIQTMVMMEDADDE